jgi:SAM-dependent methyltransferase
MMSTTRSVGDESQSIAVEDYFRARAKEYDLVEEQAYWQLSDLLLGEAIEAALAELPGSLEFLDAGGGTGRWSEWLLRRRNHAQGVLYDLSPEMTRVASAKSDSHGFGERLEIINANLDFVQDHLGSRRFDLVIALHNVLGFVNDPQQTVARLAKLLRPGGYLIAFAPNRLHAAFFNLGQGRPSEAREALMGRGRFTTDMPSIWLFTPSELRAMFQSQGLEIEQLMGFPVLLYPGQEETALRGQSTGLATLLATSFERVAELERVAMREPDAIGRGNNLFIAGRLPP